jgi:cell wall-associated NlpC family hydrolase
MGMRGCATYGLAGAAGFVFALIMLFTMAFGGTQPPTAGLVRLNTALVPAEYPPWIEAAAATCPQLTGPLVAAQLQQESGFDPTKTSPAGAQGIAQFMPGTWPTWARDDDGTGNVSAYNPHDAIMALGRYDCALARTLAAVPGDAISNMLAGYNAGPAAVTSARGVPPIPETQNYVQSIRALIPRYSLALNLGTAGANFANREIAAAAKYLGTPYIWGGGDINGPTGGGFDCSGLVLYAVHAASGGTITLPHGSDDQRRLGTAVKTRADLQPGDVIAFALDPKNPTYFDHIAIYIGDDEILQAPHTGDVVKISSLDDPYWNVPWQMRRFG